MREYLTTVDPDLLKMQGKSLRDYVEKNFSREMAVWTDEAAATKAYADALRRKYGYKHQGGGDTELYRYFMERAHQLVKPDGRVALIVPSAYQRAHGASNLRRLFFDTGTVELMLDFLNSRRIFDIHPMFRFLLYVWQGGVRKGIQRAQFGLTSSQEAEAALVEAASLRMPMTYIRAVSATMLIPDVRTKPEADLYRKLYGKWPGLGSPSSQSWNVAFRREMDMTNDSRFFVPRLQAESEGAELTRNGKWLHPVRGEMLPLYEGRMVHQYDAAAKDYVSGHGRSAVWQIPDPEKKAISPHYLVSVAIAEHRGIVLAPRAAFCDVTGHANERTVLAALVPALSVCGNKVPTCSFDSINPRLPLIWIAVANSFAIDWIMRRRASTTLNYFHWKDMPFPRIDPDSELGIELARLSSLLSEPIGCPSNLVAKDRAAVRAVIDAIVFEQFDLNPHEVAQVLSDFPLLDRGCGIPNRTATRDLVLNTFLTRRGVEDALLSDVGIDCGQGPNRLQDRLAWHEENGAQAFLPAQLARRIALAEAVASPS
jgi:hypothetical protein